MVRTDLAIESAKMLLNEGTEKIQGLPGLKVKEERYSENVKINRVTIENEVAEKLMQKPQGVYVTVETQNLLEGSEDLRTEVSHALARELSHLIPFHYSLKVLLVGLGNEKITPDALGPHTVSKVHITRHLFLMYDCDGDEEQANVCALNPGVMAQTGIETAETIKKLVDFVKPQAVIAVDSLAARDVNRMNTTIQITDTGISPGAGSNNYRTQLTEKTVGCPVIAIGVPTVIHCSTLLHDVISQFDPKILEDDSKARIPELIVTGTNIDQVIHDFSKVIADGINIALHPGIYS